MSNMSDAPKRCKPDSDLGRFELLEIFGHTDVHSTEFTQVSEAVSGKRKQVTRPLLDLRRSPRTSTVFDAGSGFLHIAQDQERQPLLPRDS